MRPDDVALVGARNLDLPELEFMRARGIGGDVDSAVAGADAVYVAFDTDVLDPAEFTPFMPEPDGLGVEQAEVLLRYLAGKAEIAGLGITAFLPSADATTLARLRLRPSNQPGSGQRAPDTMSSVPAGSRCQTL